MNLGRHSSPTIPSYCHVSNRTKHLCMCANPTGILLIFSLPPSPISVLRHFFGNLCPLGCHKAVLLVLPFLPSFWKFLFFWLSHFLDFTSSSSLIYFLISVEHILYQQLLEKRWKRNGETWHVCQCLSSILIVDQQCGLLQNSELNFSPQSLEGIFLLSSSSLCSH